MSTSRGRNISRTFPALISFPTFPLVDPRFVVAIERLSPIFSCQSIHRSEDRTLSLNFKISLHEFEMVGNFWIEGRTAWIHRRVDFKRVSMSGPRRRKQQHYSRSAKLGRGSPASSPIKRQSLHRVCKVYRRSCELVCRTHPRHSHSAWVRAFLPPSSLQPFFSILDHDTRTEDTIVALFSSARNILSREKSKLNISSPEGLCSPPCSSIHSSSSLKSIFSIFTGNEAETSCSSLHFNFKNNFASIIKRIQEYKLLDRDLSIVGQRWAIRR